MARYESAIKAGYFPVSNQHWAGITSLFKITPNTRGLDPFAGMDDDENGGHFFNSFARKHKMDGYVNELDRSRAETLVPLFGETHVVNGAAEFLAAPQFSFPFIWANPPYDNDDVDSKRLELNLLEVSWDWAMLGGYVVWCVYKSHLTDYAIQWMSSRCNSAEVYGLPGLHQDTYKQIIVVMQKQTRTRTPDEKLAFVEDMKRQRDNIPELTVLDEPRYIVPTNPQVREFFFTGKAMEIDKIISVLNAGPSATKLPAFQARLTPPPVFKRQRSIVPPRPGHTALMIGSGVLNGVMLETEEYGRAMLQADKRRVEQEVRKEYVEGQVSDKLTITIRESTQITLRLLAENGSIISFEGDDQVLPFVAKYAPVLIKEIEDAFDPVYKFDYGDYRKQLNATRLGLIPGGNGERYHLYHSQKHVIAALLEAFKHMDGVLLSASMGTGKTSLSATTLYLMTMRLANANKAKGDITLVVCPPHLIEKWPREISWQGDVMCARVDDLADLRKTISRINEAPRETRKVLLIKRSVAALGQGFEPAVYWRTNMLDARDDEGKRLTERVACCPECGHQMFDKDDRPILAIHFENKKMTCPDCHTPLWQEHRTPAGGEGKKPKKGGEDRKFALLAAELGREGHVRTLPDLIPAESKGKYETTGQFRQRLDQVIQRVLKGRIGLMIWDEVHEAQTEDSGVGQAFSRIAGAAHKKLGLTGTPMNGKSTSVYNLEYAFNPETRRLFPRGGSVRLLPKQRAGMIGPKFAKDGTLSAIARREIRQEINHDFESSEEIGSDSLRRWVNAMGVRESKQTTTFPRSEMTGSLTGTSTSRRSGGVEAAGITPDLVQFMMPHTITMGLIDLGKWLPKFTETTEAIPMDDEVFEMYQGIMDTVKKYMGEHRYQPGGTAGVMSSYLQWAMSWPNNPRAERPITDSIRDKRTTDSKKILVAQAPALHIPQTNKERRLIELVKADREAGRRTIVFVNQTQTNDVQPHLAAMLEREIEGAKPYILRSNTGAVEREGIIQDAVDAGYNILICHPKLVETGLDLVQFQHIIVHEIIFEIRTLMQATKRCWRLNQEAEECLVTYLYYQGALEQAAMDLMSRKSRAMKMLLGDLGMTGFDALTAGDEALGMEAALVQALAHKGKAISMNEGVNRAETAAMKEVDRVDADFWQANPWLAEDDGVVESETVVEVAVEEMAAFEMTPNQVAYDIVRRALAKLQGQQVAAPELSVLPGRDWKKLKLAI